MKDKEIDSESIINVEQKVIVCMPQEKPIEIGSYVKYIRSDTKGTVTEIKKDKDGIWVLIDTTNLYYKIESVEVIEKNTEKVVKQLKSNDDSTITSIKEKRDLKTPSHITGGG